MRPNMGDLMVSVVNPTEFGLSPSASGEQNARALNEASRKFMSAPLSVRFKPDHPGILHIPGGEYLIGHDPTLGPKPVGWSLPMRRGRMFVNAPGVKLVADESLAGGTMVDMLGAQGICGDLPWLSAPSEIDAPLYGYQMGFYRDGMAAGGHNIDRLTVRGFFAGAGVLNAGAEVCQFHGAVVQNFHPSPAAYAWIADGNTKFPVVTNLDTSKLTPGASRTNLAVDLRGSSFQRIRPNQSEKVGGPALWLGTGDHADFSLTSFVTESHAVEMGGVGPIYNGINFHGFVTEHPQDCVIKLVGPATMQSCKFVTGLSRPPMFIDTCGFDLEMTYCEIDPGSHFTGALFGGGGKVTVMGSRNSRMLEI